MSEQNTQRISQLEEKNARLLAWYEEHYDQQGCEQSPDDWRTVVDGLNKRVKELEAQLAAALKLTSANSIEYVRDVRP